MSSQFCAPVLRRADGSFARFRRVTLGRDADYSERDIQNLLFGTPGILPVEEIDNAFLDMIPICTELPTSDGRLDVLYVTPLGRLAFVETKLWRNPQARREVVAQIIDYASELNTWSVPTLQDRVRQRTGRNLFDIIREAAPQTDEAMFFDGLAECLEGGRFLLLVCGDGIRSGTEKMAEFLNRRTSLDFTFGLVEVAIYRSDLGDLYQARVLARTERILREFQRLRGGTDRILVETTDDESPSNGAEQDRLRRQQDFWLGFWTEVRDSLVRHGADHSTFRAERRFRASGILPTDAGYLLAYFEASANTIGVAISLDAGKGRDIYDALLEEKDEIEREFGAQLRFAIKPSDRSMIGVSRPYLNPGDPDERAQAVEWFAATIARMDTVFRPRIERIEKV